VALKALRSRSRQRNVFDTELDAADLSELSSGGNDVEHTVSHRRDIELLRESLSTLPPAQAETVVLHDLMGHALAEIATITGASIAAAQSRLVRGRKALAAWMTEARAKGRSHGGP
jgi:RNA polymerase sigma-70 factor (ECF subfamily)